MASTYVQYNGDGTNRNFAVPFPYLSRDYVIVTLNAVATTAFTWLNDNLIQMAAAPGAGVLVDVRRKTPQGTPVDFEDGSVLAERDLDLLAVYTAHLSAEALDSSEDSLKKNIVGQFTARSARVTEVAPGTQPTDAVNKAQLDAQQGDTVAVLVPLVASATASKNAAATSAGQADTARQQSQAIAAQFGNVESAVVGAQNWAGAAAGSAGSAAGSASTAGVHAAAASLARDASLIQAGVYATEAEGRAAVADGAAFKVQGAGDTAAFEYRKVNNATMSTLIGSYASSGAVAAIRAATGANLLDPNLIVRGQYYSPGQNKIITDAAYRRSGFIPVTAGLYYARSGVSSSNASVAFFATPTVGELALSTFTTEAGVAPSGANWAVVNITNGGQDSTAFDLTACLEQSTYVTSPGPFKRLVPTSVLKDAVAKSDILEAVVPNLFNPAKINWAWRLSPGTGAIVAADGNALIASGFVPVTEGAWYSMGGSADAGASRVVSFFGGSTSTAAISRATLVTIEGGVKFQVPVGTGIRGMMFQVAANVGTTTVNGVFQVNPGETLNAYAPYSESVRLKAAVMPAGPDLSSYAQRASLFDQVSFNKINPAAVDFTKRYSTGTKSLVFDSALLIAASAYIPVVEGGWYTVSGVGIYGLATGPTYCQGGFFTGSLATAAVDNITFVAPVIGGGAAFQVPVGLGITHVVVSLNKTVAGTPSALTGPAMFEVGEMATTHQDFLLKDTLKASLLPAQAAVGSGLNIAAWYKFTAGEGGKSLAAKFPTFRGHWLKRDKDLCVVNTGTSLTARSTEHCTAHPDAKLRPPLMHSNNLVSILWDRMRWDGQQYRRYDATAYFTESVGTFGTSSALAEWDDGAYRAGLTRYSETTGARVAFVVPVGAWQFNFIYRTDSTGTTANTVAVAEGNGKMEVQNEAGAWVEANGYSFSMREAAPVSRSVSIPNPSTDSFATASIPSKGNTTYQKRLKMRCKGGAINSLATTKAVTVTGASAGRFMYWGVEWSPREFMLTYINAARGSHATQATAATGLPRYQDNEVWGFKPDLLFFELPIHNDGTDATTAFVAGYWARLTNNFVFRPDYELSLKTRGASFGLTPEVGMFTSSIAWNFGGIADDGSLKFNAQADGSMMTSLDKFQQAHAWVAENHPEAVCVNAANRWVDAAVAIFGDLRTATTGSGPGGATFTNEGSHWNDTGCKVIGKVLAPVFDFT